MSEKADNGWREKTELLPKTILKLKEEVTK